MNDIYQFVERPYNLRSKYTLERKRDHTAYHGSESLSSLTPKSRNVLPNLIKNSASLKEFKAKIILAQLTIVFAEYMTDMLEE